jgi:polyisoprenyl-phosphate glycosyltransferase
MTPARPQVNLVIPLYNEQKVLPALIARLTDLMDRSSLRVSVILVDDGSIDETAFLMRQTSLNDHRFTSIILSRNFGHQRALTAGLAHVDAENGVLILDGDLQDPPELLETFYEYYKQGYDVVYAVRKKRKENIFKTAAYKFFYRLLKRISYFEIPLDSGDFSFISRRVVDDINAMKEESRFLRGMRGWVGYRQIGVPYERFERQAGSTKYSFKKLLSLALNGIFNFSEMPIRFITYLGIGTVCVSITYLGYTLYKRFYYDVVPEGFTAVIFAIVLLGGVQLISLGVIGEYILRIFFQVKNRPLFIVKELIKDKKEHGKTVL